MKRLKVKVRRAYNNRKLGEHYQSDLKGICKQLLAAKKNAQETFLRSVVQNEGKCWSEFYKYVKRRKGNRENIPAIKDRNGRLITDSIGKAKFLNSYYASVFSCERNIPQLQSAHSGEHFNININIIRKRERERSCGERGRRRWQ